jgi:hypothetical protein
MKDKDRHPAGLKYPPPERMEKTKGKRWKHLPRKS